MATPKGHIKLDNRWYMIAWQQYQQSTANPYVAQVGSGAGAYEDISDWSAWLMDDWTAGLGKLVGEGGILFGSADTRFKNRLMLPPALHMAGLYAPDHEYASYRVAGAIDGELSIGTTGDLAHITIKNGSYNLAVYTEYAWVLLRGAPGTQVDIEMYSGAQGTLHYTDTITITDEFGYKFYRAGPFDLWGKDVQWIGVKPTVAGDVVYIPYTVGADTWSHGLIYKNNAGTWTSQGKSAFFITTREQLSSSKSLTPSDVVRYANSAGVGDLFAVERSGLSGIGAKYGSYGNIANGSMFSAPLLTPTDIVVWNGTLYIAFGDGKEMATWSGDASYTATTLTGIYATKLFKWNNYLYRALGNQLWYTADGITWTGPFEVGPDDYNITGMAAFGGGNAIVVATTEALYQFAEGDFVFGIRQFGSISDVNGRAIVNYNGDLYISHAGGLYRMTGNYSILDVWLSEDEDLPASSLGLIRHLAIVNNYLFALVDGDTTDAFPVLIAYDTVGWHHIATLPQGMNGSKLFYDRSTNVLFVSTQEGFVFYLYIPDQANNPLRDAVYQYSGHAWVETDWFFGNLYEVVKDFESVYISADNTSSTRYAKVYYKADDDTSWTLLGTFDSDRKEIRWSDLTTRPNTYQLKLGILLITDDNSETPVIRAIRTKYHAMVLDRFKWQLVLLAGNNQQMNDGSTNEYNATQTRAHILDLVKRTQPIRFQDIDGAEYLVKFVQHFTQPEKAEIINQEQVFDSRHNVLIQEV